jgi:hypothetical protein
VDSYLEIAEDVLRRVRRPLSALQILRAAYENGTAPPHLRGRTQHKTLGARLSEDILQLREGSRFYRTAPGRFLLRDLADDPSIPEEMRRPIIARRRRRELAQKRSLAFDRASLNRAVSETSEVVDSGAVLELISRGCFHYASSARHRRSDDVVVWAFMLVIRAGCVLTYRQGHYREDRDTFMHRRSIGFYTPVIDEDLSLFDRIDHGIVSSGLKALAADLDLQDRQLWPVLAQCSQLRTFVYPDAHASRDLLAVVSLACPDWLDPTSKRLAINDLQWLDLRSLPNDREDFDPWSQAILYEARDLAVGTP